MADDQRAEQIAGEGEVALDGSHTPSPAPRAEDRVYVEHRWPAQDRATYPTRWVQWFGWRQIVVWTPKVGLRSAVITLRLWPRRGSVIGVVWFTDDDDEAVVRFGVGLAELEVQGMTWTR